VTMPLDRVCGIHEKISTPKHPQKASFRFRELSQAVQSFLFSCFQESRVSDAFDAMLHETRRLYDVSDRLA
jgi:hypothetical protein